MTNVSHYKTTKKTNAYNLSTLTLQSYITTEVIILIIMKLHYLANLFATKHYIGSALGLDSRRLTLDQAAAAKRVDDAVNVAMSSVENGDVTGVAFALNYVALSEGEQELTVNLRLPGVDRNLNVLIDTGSSSLAFCNKSLADEATDINKINYAQCTAYSGYFDCPDSNVTAGILVFYSGQMYQGDVGAYNNQGEEIASMDNVSFAIMEEKQFYACNGPSDGILGVSYWEGNDAFPVNSSDFEASSVWVESCKNPDQYEFSVGYESIGNCNAENPTTLPAPLETALTKGVESGNNKAEAFGLYLDYAATIGSVNDTIIPSLGIFFLETWL